MALHHHVEGRADFVTANKSPREVPEKFKKFALSPVTPSLERLEGCQHANTAA
jgi:hypothetical protein